MNDSGIDGGSVHGPDAGPELVPEPNFQIQANYDIRFTVDSGRHQQWHYQGLGIRFAFDFNDGWNNLSPKMDIQRKEP